MFLPFLSISDKVQAATATPRKSLDDSDNALNDNDGEDEDATPYNVNEVNAKFKITSEHWTDDLDDPSSENYRKMSETITRGIHEMLEEQNLTQQADFDITILGFRSGQFICTVL